MRTSYLVLALTGLASLLVGPLSGLSTAQARARDLGAVAAELAQGGYRVPFLKGDLGVCHGVLSPGGELQPGASQVASLASVPVALGL